jgi:CRISPR/Cas system-associated exonuclease Cas4 (RecB family)
MGLKDLAKKIVLSQSEKTLGQEFEMYYYKTVLLQHPPREPKVDMFSPSSLNKCSREIYYMINGIKPEPNLSTPEHLLGSWAAITDAGTDRHERIQTTLTEMKKTGLDIEWIDVEEYVKEHKPVGTSVIEKSGMETKLFSELLSARFLCDGIVKLKGKFYIIEIKTMNSRKYAIAENKNSMLPEHLMQAAAYSTALGIDDVLYIYENRENNQIRVYERHVREEHKKAVLNKIFAIQSYKEKGAVPPKCTDDKRCMYCSYKQRCQEDGYTPNLFPDLKIDIDE